MSGGRIFLPPTVAVVGLWGLSSGCPCDRVATHSGRATRSCISCMHALHGIRRGGPRPARGPIRRACTTPPPDRLSALLAKCRWHKLVAQSGTESTAFHAPAALLALLAPLAARSRRYQRHAMAHPRQHHGPTSAKGVCRRKTPLTARKTRTTMAFWPQDAGLLKENNLSMSFSKNQRLAGKTP